MIGPRDAARYRGPQLDRFRASEQLSSFGLGGFWRYACERFFVLEEHMRRTGLERCLHIESDVLLYLAPGDFDAWLRARYAGAVAVCPLTESEDTAAAMYVGSLAGLAALNDALLELVALGLGPTPRGSRRRDGERDADAQDPPTERARRGPPDDPLRGGGDGRAVPVRPRLLRAVGGRHAQPTGSSPTPATTTQSGASSWRGAASPLGLPAALTVRARDRCSRPALRPREPPHPLEASGRVGVG